MLGWGEHRLPVVLGWGEHRLPVVLGWGEHRLPVVLGWGEQTTCSVRVRWTQTTCSVGLRWTQTSYSVGVRWTQTTYTIVLGQSEHRLPLVLQRGSPCLLVFTMVSVSPSLKDWEWAIHEGEVRKENSSLYFVLVCRVDSPCYSVPPFFSFPSRIHDFEVLDFGLLVLLGLLVACVLELLPYWYLVYWGYQNLVFWTMATTSSLYTWAARSLYVGPWLQVACMLCSTGECRWTALGHCSLMCLC